MSDGSYVVPVRRFSDNQLIIEYYPQDDGKVRLEALDIPNDCNVLNTWLANAGLNAFAGSSSVPFASDSSLSFWFDDGSNVPASFIIAELYASNCSVVVEDETQWALSDIIMSFYGYQILFTPDDQYTWLADL